MIDNNYLLIYQNDNYKVYQCSNEKMGFYYLCVPNQIVEIYQLYVGFPKSNLMNCSKDEVINEIKNVYDHIYKKYNASLYALPNIDSREINEAASENDHKLYANLFDKIQSMTADINNIMNKNKNKLNQVISFVKENESETKFVDWLEIKLPKFIQGVNISRKKKVNNTSTDTLDSVSVNSSKSVVMDTPVITNNNVKTKKLTPKGKTTGFSSLSILTLILSISLVVGIAISYLMIK